MAEGGRTWRTWQLLVGMAIALVVGIVAGAGRSEQDQTVSATGDQVEATGSTSPAPTTAPTTPAPTAPPTTLPPTTTTTLPPTTTTAPSPKTSFSDGSYRVGVDIAPGTYRSSGSATDCYWQRLSNFTGTDNIIANYRSHSPTTVTILASDAGFESRRCGTWTKV